jgi:hypothetical protein
MLILNNILQITLWCYYYTDFLLLAIDIYYKIGNFGHFLWAALVVQWIVCMYSYNNENNALMYLSQ